MLWIVGGATIVLALSKLSDQPIATVLAVQMTHSQWEGFTFYDLIFPLFLFIVGVSLVFSLDKAIASKSMGDVVLNVVRRSILLYAFGVFYMGGLSQRWPEIALGGVLHRIAACYLFAAVIYLMLRTPSRITAVGVLLLVGYWAFLTYTPIPNLKLEQATVSEVALAIGSDSPQKIATSVKDKVTGSYEEGLNAANYVDFLYLPGRKYSPGIKTGAFYINEGLASTIPSIALTLFGVLAGILLKSQTQTPSQKCIWLLCAGAACICIGLLWSYQFPLIKRIWTSSFILLTGGMSAVLLAFFYWIIDVKKHQTWCRPLVWFGSNAITIYLLFAIVDFKAIAERIVGGDVSYLLDSYVGLGCGALLIAMARFTLGVLLLRFMYNHQIFFKAVA